MRAAAALALAALVLGGCGVEQEISAAGRLTIAAAPAAGAAPAAPTAPRPVAEVRWRRSTAVGLPFRGRLRAGVLLPAGHADFFTYDLTRDRLPNPAWRRWGTDRLVQTVLWVAAQYRERHPGEARVGVADLSRRRGGPFGRGYGGLGHASHQNGLDADLLYPRRDGREAPTATSREIDRRRAQDLLDLFLEAGAVKVFVGQKTGLRGPKDTVLPLHHHDDHMHVRIAPGPSGRFR